MCEYGNTTEIYVTVPRHLSHTGETYQKKTPVDLCIVDLILALNNEGIKTISSCCGHGKADGSILLEDGRELIIKTKESKIEQEKREKTRLAKQEVFMPSSHRT